MDTTAFEAAARGLEEQFREAGVEEMLVKRDEPGLAPSTFIDLHREIIERMDRLAASSPPWGVVWGIERAIRRFKNPEEPESRFGDENEAASALSEVATLVDETWLAGVDVRTIISFFERVSVTPEPLRPDPTLVYAPLRRGDAAALLLLRFDWDSLSSALASEVDAAPRASTGGGAAPAHFST